MAPHARLADHASIYRVIADVFGRAGVRDVTGGSRLVRHNAASRLLRAAVPLLSSREIKAFFAAAATLNAHCPWRWQAVAFFTLMHSCGLRTGETRLLRPEHVHLRDANLDVVSSKGNRSRRLPLTGDVTEVLAGCDRVSAPWLGPSRRTFFVSATGKQVTAATVGKVFNSIWDQAGLPRPAAGQQPRPYDFQHHFKPSTASDSPPDRSAGRAQIGHNRHRKSSDGGRQERSRDPVAVAVMRSVDTACLTLGHCG